MLIKTIHLVKFLLSKKKLLLALLLFSLNQTLYSQSILKGVVLTEKDSTAINGAYVVLKNTKNNKVIAYTVTDAKGLFLFNQKISLGVYTLKIQHLNFNVWENNLIVDSITNKTINLTILIPEKNNELEEVVLKIKNPILIKQDTIIYDIPHFADKFDENLESVLKKIKGFKILPSGEIEVEGKRIRKVLVDGKEISDSGASLITKSINPKLVKSIEVRFDEKNSAIKESLLEATEYVVLDIKLKDDFDKSLFGKSRITTGYRKNLETGGYINSFSLNKKSRFHLFSEYDDFGFQTISLAKIRNIGQEALEKLFERPADFKGFSSREAFRDEIYGFRDYSNWSRSIIGLTTRFDLSKKWNLFFGSYNSYNDKLKEQHTEQSFVNSNTLILENENRNKFFNSKNKIELKYDNLKTKMKFNSNYVYDKNDNVQIQNIINSANFNFNINSKQESWYNNFSFEKIISSSLGFEVKASYSTISSTNEIRYLHNSVEVADFLIDSQANPTFNYNQIAKTKFSDFYLQVGLNHNTKLGKFKYSYTQKRRSVNYFQKGINSNTLNPIPSFNQDYTNYLYRDYSFAVNHFFRTETFSFDNTVNLIYNIVPNTFVKKNEEFNVNYSSSISYKPNLSTTYSVNFKNKLSSYPLLKYLIAKKLLNFQTIQNQASVIDNTREQTIEANIYNSFPNLNLDISYLNGKTNNSNILSAQDTFFVFEQLGQLSSNYNMVSTILSTKIKKIPLEFILEPEAIWYKNENILDDIKYFTRTKWLLLGLKINSISKNNRLNFKIYPKYSRIGYFNDFSDSKSYQNLFSTKVNLSYKAFKKRVLIGLDFRNVNISGISKTNFNNVNFNVKGVYNHLHWKLEFSNILKTHSFDRQVNTPIYLIAQSNNIFSRYLKLGVEFNF